MADDRKRVYTYVSGKAVKGLQRLAGDREVYVKESPSARGYTVITTARDLGRRERESELRIPA